MSSVREYLSVITKEIDFFIIRYGLSAMMTVADFFCSFILLFGNRP